MPATLRALAPLLVFPLLAACSGGGEDPASSGPAPDGPWTAGVALEATPQGHGDAAVGRDLLLNGNFMSCGVPWKLWEDPTFGPTVQGTLGGADGEAIEGRTGHNTTLPYSLNAFTTADGAEVVNRNCLSCHGGRFDGKLVLGLGNATADFTGGVADGAPASLPATLLESLGLDAAEQANMEKVLRFGRAAGDATRMRTIGMNPAEQLTGVLIAHHDRDTLAWLEEPLYDVRVVRDEDGAVIPDARLTSDPPPWWRAHKKNALFYNGMARGDHRGTMALATSVCVDTLDEARRVDGLFRDMHAYVLTLVAPAYTRTVDRELAGRGKDVFLRDCAGCHGTYGDDAADDSTDTYPNLLLPLDVVGTDTAVARAPLDNDTLLDWYNGSFYGQVATAVAEDPFPGYMAPPLDGIWATAPYLHNGSVPTVELLLDSSARPTYWRRVDLDDTNFDEDALGWPWESVPTPQAEAPEAERPMIYDTTYYSQTNGGHTFGDHLTADERRAVIEYLKTL